ncbi:MAG: flavodoxin domain-containing protein [Candidatus Hermodarchaeota archaeon]
MSSKITKKVVILYGTCYGSTEEVAVKIGELLKESGIDANVYNLEDIINDKKFNLDSYDGIILGTAIYNCSNWTKGAKQFLKGFSKRLKQGNQPLAIFTLCGTASDPTKIPELKKSLIEDKLKKHSLKTQCYDVFGGVLDLSEESRMSKFDIKIGKLMSNTLPNIKKGQNNDFRDWNKIRAFAESFLEILLSS